MANKDFIYERIRNFSGIEFDPNDDKQVLEVLRFNLNIHLPQRASVNEALESSTSDHEIIGLILQYRTIS